MIYMPQLKCSLDVNKNQLKKELATKLKINESDITKFEIIRESIDARKNEIHLVYGLAFETKNEEQLLKKHKNVLLPYSTVHYVLPEVNQTQFTNRPIVVGFGPCGIFAALILAEAGLNPLVFERGSDVDRRVEKVEHFWKTGELDTECNVQYGEGGAGTFSDGKLTARSKDPRIIKVNDEFIEAGADPEIRYQAYPHIGTDHLRIIVKNLRKKIIDLGGEVIFDAKVEDFLISHDEIMGVVVNGQKVYSNHVILAIGHSSEETFENLYQHHVNMESKSFAIGVRVEHKQTLIDSNQYGQFLGHPKLHPAEYHLTYTSSVGKGVYSFCMCPGGYVVPSASAQGQLVVNGMSYKARSGENANSAILVQVGPEDFGSGVMDGVHYQKQIEKKAFTIAGGKYKAPVQRIDDFLKHKASKEFGEVKPTYCLGTTFIDFHQLFDKNISISLEEAFTNFDRKIPGFASKDSVMTGIESRSSSPIRIPRDKSFQSTNVRGLFPSGEGAGYAGGIVSAAIDGIKCAEALINSLK